MRHSSLAASLILAGLALAPAAATAQDAIPAPKGEFGCVVDVDTPCRGRLDFQVGNAFEFRIGGPGTVSIINEGNRRCRLEYSATNSSVATTGKELNLPPSGVQTIQVVDATGVIVRFFNQGFGSQTCDLQVTLER